jgi:NAD(P)-dependent dehydrogenase (short-subunit alcohol dehydrogenase family)
MPWPGIRARSKILSPTTTERSSLVAVAFNVTDLGAIQSLGGMSLSSLRTLVSLHNNHLPCPQKKSPSISLILWRLAIVQSFAPSLNKIESTTSSKASAIVNLNSIGSLVNFHQCGTNSAAKAASHSLTQAQRRDLPNSLAIGVDPGPIDTDMSESLPSEAIIDASKNGTEDFSLM